MHRSFRRATPLVACLALTAPATAHAALSAVGPLDPATSAPAFYTDANGLQLGLCHPGTANCGPAVPGEDFYNMATSTFTMPNGGIATLTLNMTLAPNASGNPAAFNRVRIQLDGAPAGTYNITHPYGTDTVVVSAAGRRGRTTIDVGCAVTAVGPCNFADAMAGRYGPFLTAAPGAPAPPAGFIGDAVSEVPVTGSPLGTNFFRVEGPGLPAGGAQHDTFALMGKVFTGIVPPAPAPAPAPAPTTAPTGGTTAPAAAPAPAPALTSTPSPAPVPAPAPAQVVTAAPIVAPVKTTPVLKVDSLSVSRSVSLRSARAHGLRLTVFTLDGTRVVKIRLLRNGRVVTRTERIVNADGVLTIVLPASAKGRHKLVRGTYTLQVTPGGHPGQYGQTTTKKIRIG